MKLLRNYSIAAMLTFTATAVFAQGTPPPPAAVSGPIDNGAVVLLVAAAAFGYRHLKQKAKVATV